MERKGQAAMEFLMTYGWAILAAIIVIGVLAYFGVFSPGKYAPNTCVVSAPFYCNAYNAIAASGVTIEIKNNGGDDYAIAGLNVINAGAVTCTEAATSPATVTVGSTGSVTLTCTGLAAGNVLKGDIVIKYTKPSSTVQLQSTGTITQKIT